MTDDTCGGGFASGLSDVEIESISGSCQWIPPSAWGPELVPAVLSSSRIGLDRLVRYRRNTLLFNEIIRRSVRIIVITVVIALAIMYG